MDRKSQKDRYEIEHVILPDLFRESGRYSVRRILKEKGDFFVSLFENLNAGDRAYRCPYTDEQFLVETFSGKEAGKRMKRMVRVTFPTPDASTQCVRLYGCYNAIVFRNVRCIMVEKSFEYNMICEWGKDGSHMNYGLAPEAEEEERMTIWKIVS